MLDGQRSSANNGARQCRGEVGVIQRCNSTLAANESPERGCVSQTEIARLLATVKANESPAIAIPDISVRVCAVRGDVAPGAEAPERVRGLDLVSGKSLC